MKKLLLILLILVLAQACFAQNAFKDVPVGHWAYDDIRVLSEAGVLTGYPDGTFDGKNTLTRYEFASAIAKLLPLIKDDGIPGLATQYDLKELLARDSVSDPDKPDLSGLASADALNALRRLCDEFENELMEFNFRAVDFRDDLARLSEKLEELEQQEHKIVLKGHAVFYADGIVAGDKSIYDNDNYRITKNRRHQSFFKDVQLDLNAKVNDNLTLVTTTIIGDYLQKQAGDEEVYDTDSFLTPYYFYLSQEELWGNVRVGRQPFKINQYIFNHEDPDLFIEMPRLWDADFVTEGITYSGDLGKFDSRLWLVRPVYDWNDVILESPYYVPFRIKDKISGIGGGELGYTLDNGIRFSGLFTGFLAKNKTAGDYADKTYYYGGGASVPIGYNGDLTYYTKEKPTLLDLKLLYKTKLFTIDAGYKSVDPYYAGIAYNIGSDNSKGWYVKLKYTGLEKFAFDFRLEQYRVKYPGAYSNYNDIYSWLKGATSSLDGSHKYQFKTEYVLTPIDTLFADYESIRRYKGDVTSDQFTLGWRRKVSEGVELLLKYRYYHKKSFGTVNKAHMAAIQAGIDF
ncbi:MAG: S-layer homology domain-containing protein [Abditibacteriota bacterium]|nr:S-layer homology domain-containing protein [Abditibacteriota bacterium]